MKDWKSIKEIISNFQQKGSARKYFFLNRVKEKLKEKFKKEDFEVDFQNGILLIKVKSPVLGQEFFLQKEEIKKDITALIKEEGFSGYKLKEVAVRMRR
jgi:hypothetical protein